MRRVDACPKCNSTKIKSYQTDRTGELGLPDLWVCKKCKYTGYKVAHITQEEADQQNDALYLLSSEGQTAFQKSAFWKSTAPAGIVFGALFLAISPFLGFILIGMGAWMYRFTFFKQNSTH